MPAAPWFPSLRSALEDARVRAPVKREILLYLTRVVEAQPHLLSRGECGLPQWTGANQLQSSSPVVEHTK